MNYVNTADSYLAIIFFGGGSSWARQDTAFEAIKNVKAHCEDDWGRLFSFSETEPARINVYDATGVEGWYADDHGVFNGETNEKIPYLYTVTAKLKNKGKK